MHLKPSFHWHPLCPLYRPFSTADQVPLILGSFQLIERHWSCMSGSASQQRNIFHSRGLLLQQGRALHRRKGAWNPSPCIMLKLMGLLLSPIHLWIFFFEADSLEVSLILILFEKINPAHKHISLKFRFSVKPGYFKRQTCYYWFLNSFGKSLIFIHCKALLGTSAIF